MSFFELPTYLKNKVFLMNHENLMSSVVKCCCRSVWGQGYNRACPENPILKVLNVTWDRKQNNLALCNSFYSREIGKRILKVKLAACKIKIT